ncbi:MAG: glycosyltransferase [Planctomycetota bacterium]|nr:glycosyltransferase [Planctomycetota bacterium]MDA1180108.1 glycosyltransferase [Planctomycetota bacterium]
MNVLSTLIRSFPRPQHTFLDERGPLRTMFVNTSMPVGGAETLLMNLMRSFDRDQICPEFCCLKDFGPVGEELSSEFTGFRNLLAHKYDPRILSNMIRLFRQRQIDAIVTVGAGDKMFWGRLAGWLAGVPVVLSALHSTGWPDTVGWLNRQLTPITDSFVAVAPEHGRYLVLNENLPLHKVRVVPNGVDTDRFRPSVEDGARIRRELGLGAEVRLCGVVAALRPEKNLELLLQAFRAVVSRVPSVHLAIIGDGPERQNLTRFTEQWCLTERVHFLGTRRDVPQILNAFDVFALSSRMEANPVSILEALACGVPVAWDDRAAKMFYRDGRSAIWWMGILD